jgi:hypothetical protein
MAKIVGCQLRRFRCHKEVAPLLGLPDEVPHEFLALCFVCFTLPWSLFLLHCFPFFSVLRYSALSLKPLQDARIHARGGMLID